MHKIECLTSLVAPQSFAHDLYVLFIHLTAKTPFFVCTYLFLITVFRV